MRCSREASLRSCGDEYLLQAFPCRGGACAKAQRQERYLIPGQQEEGLVGEGKWARPQSGEEEDHGPGPQGTCRLHQGPETPAWAAALRTAHSTSAHT